jgi:hypothetical protein
VDAGDADALPAGEPVTIKNSGSTNAPGFTITVTPEGQATWHVNPPKGLPSPLQCTTMDGTTALATTMTANLFADLAAAEPFAARQFDMCAKSVSFGTFTSVTYAGASIVDVECGSGTDPRAEALTVDTMGVEKAIATACH